MDMFVIRGSRPLSGRGLVSGSKNAALPMMAASLAAEGTTVLRGVPDLVDVRTLSQLLDSLGMQVTRDADDSLLLQVTSESQSVADYDLVRRMRASFCVLGPLLARRGRACVSLPGGCNIGDRPINLHLKGLRALGAEIRVERGYVIAETDGLRGSSIYLGGPFGSTVTGTCNVMIAASLAEGVTTIEAASCEPEVVDLGRFLNQMGARISGLGTPFLRIEGVRRLESTEYHVIPDRIEAATLMIAAAITNGEIEIDNVMVSHLTAVIETLREVGIAVEVASSGPGPTAVRVSAPKRPGPTDCIALPYPGIPTDLQAQLMALLARADGISMVTDKVFPDRFLHAAELVRMGARIRREGPSAVISGVPRLNGACVMASDLRASAALVLAAMAADGDSVVRRIYHLDRGYQRLERKLRALGADIHRVEDTPENMPESLRLSDWSDQDHRLAQQPPHFLRRPDRQRGVQQTRDENADQ